MNRVKSTILTLLLAVGMNGVFTGRLSAGGSEDSLRTEIGRTLRQCQQLLATPSSSSLDSAVMLVEPLCERILDEFGVSDTLLALAYCYLGRCHFHRSDYTGAADYSQRSIEIWQASGGHNIHILDGLDDLADCHKARNDLVQFEQAIEQRFQLLETLPDTLTSQERRQIVVALEDRGELRTMQNRFDEAYTDYNLALELLKQDVVGGARLRADMTLAVGVAFASQGDYAEAERYMIRALDLIREAYHPKHHGVLHTFIGLSNVVNQLGDPIRANQWADSALALADEMEYNLPVLDYLYRTKAEILIALDSVDSALDYANRAVEMTMALNPYNARAAIWYLGTAGRIAFSAGRVEVGVRRYDEVVARARDFLRTVFGYASEEQMLAYVEGYASIRSDYLSAAVAYPESQSIRGATNMILNSKGLAIDALTAARAAAACSGDSVLDALIADRKATCTEIANLSLSGNGNNGDLADRLGNLYARKSTIEKEMSSLCAGLSSSQTDSAVSTSDVSSVLPDNSVLCEFIRYQRHDLDKQPRTGSWLGTYYLVLILKPGNEVHLVDLGPASPIDSLIETYRRSMSNAGLTQRVSRPAGTPDRFTEVSVALFTRLIEPLQSALKGVEEVFVAADGMLNLLPFETLTGDGEHYLIEDYQFVYLTSGRDLLNERPEIDSRDAIVVADPDYMVDPVSLPVFASNSETILASRGYTETPECLASMFPPLPMTRQEGSAIAELLSQAGGLDVSYLESGEAREGTLKNLKQAPRILHVATHGYFCPEADRDALSNPLLRSGLVLAGANRTIGRFDDDHPNTEEDGILTALEASGLYLIGTELVVLSACQTGIGEVQSGEGVFGLRRAFQHAGARSLITSMFAIPDGSTVTLMERFYENWLSGQSKSTALRNASLSVLTERREKHESTHPLFWGGFILVGDPN